MTQKNKQVRLATTAIAAVLAFSSTPLLAQETGTPPDTAVETPAPVADPLAPEPTAEPVTTAVPPAPEPKVETTTTTTRRTQPARAPPARRRPVRRRPAPPRRPLPQLLRPPRTPATVPVLAEPMPPIAEALPAPVAEPAPAPAPETTMVLSDDALPYAGAAALGLLALGGAGIASRRRRRRREAEDFEARQQALDAAEAEPVAEIDPTPEFQPEPVLAYAYQPIHDPVPARPAANRAFAEQPAADADAPVTKLPNGFDLSRFGRHTQAAYRGPTEDNPSLSLKYRLRRAVALDQQERRLEEQAAAHAPAKVPARGKWESRQDADFLFRRAGKPQFVNQH